MLRTVLSLAAYEIDLVIFQVPRTRHCHYRVHYTNILAPISRLLTSNSSHVFSGLLNDGMWKSLTMCRWNYVCKEVMKDKNTIEIQNLEIKTNVKNKYSIKHQTN